MEGEERGTRYEVRGEGRGVRKMVESLGLSAFLRTFASRKGFGEPKGKDLCI